MSATPSAAPGDVFAAAGLAPVGCDRCDALHLATPERLGQPCPACGRGALGARPGVSVASDPEMVLPLDIDPARLKQALERYVRRVPFRASELDPELLRARAVAVWLPSWLVDVSVGGSWAADMGFDYEAKSSRETMSGGRWRSEEVIDVRVRWEERVGEVWRREHNVAVPALATASNPESQVGDTPWDGLTDFAPLHLAGAVVRLPDRDPDEVWPDAEEVLRLSVAERCRVAAGADHVRDFTLRAAHEDLHWTWLLKPIWATWYEGGGSRRLLLVNGRTGEVAGPALSSMPKALALSGILLIVAAGLVVLALLVMLVGVALPPLIVLGLAALVLPVLVAMAAIWPVARAWSWNREQLRSR